MACVVPHLQGQVNGDLRQLTLSTWTTAQGLPQNFITAIDQTPNGFLWIGTKGGLARFDGLNFRTSFANEVPALHGSVNDVVHDRAGQLWVTTNLGLLRGRDGRWVQIPLPPQTSGQAGHLVIAHDDTLLVGIADAVWRFNPVDRSFGIVEGAAKYIRGFAEDSHGTLWLTDSKAVTSIDLRGNKAYYPLPNASLIKAASDGRVYAGDGHHIFRFDGAAFVPIKNVGTEESVDVTWSHDGSLWIATGGLEGLARKSQGGVQRFGLHDGLVSNDVRTIFEDRDGAIWIWYHLRPATPQARRVRFLLQSRRIDWLWRTV